MWYTPVKHLWLFAWCVITAVITGIVLSEKTLLSIIVGSSFLLVSIYGYEYTHKRILLPLISPFRLLDGTYREREEARQALVSAVMPVCLVGDVISIILEYERTVITMSCPLDGAHILVADDNTVMHLQNGPALEPRIIGRLALRPTVMGSHSPAYTISYGIGFDNGEFYSLSSNGEMDPYRHPILDPQPRDGVSFGRFNGKTTFGVASSTEVAFTVPTRNLVSSVFVQLPFPHQYFRAILHRSDGRYVLTSIEHTDTLVHIRMPNDRFILFGASSDTIYALTATGQMYSLPRKEMWFLSPGWSIRPMPLVRKVVCMQTAEGDGLVCLALLRDGTLWRLGEKGDRQLPTFSSNDAADDVFPSDHGYTVLRYNRFMTEFVPSSFASS
jgi:hypothetical protein